MMLAVAAAIAAGLNPYTVLFLVAALATWTPRVTFVLPWVGTPSSDIMTVVVIVAGLALPFDLILARYAQRQAHSLPQPRALSLVALAHRSSLLVVPLVGAVLAMGLSESSGSWVATALIGMSLAAVTRALLTIVTAWARRSPAWAGLGHIPVLIAATTAASITIPLAVIHVILGLAVSLIALGLLAIGALAAQRASRRAFVPGSMPASPLAAQAGAYPHTAVGRRYAFLAVPPAARWKLFSFIGALPRQRGQSAR